MLPVAAMAGIGPVRKGTHKLVGPARLRTIFGQGHPDSIRVWKGQHRDPERDYERCLDHECTAATAGVIR